MTDLKFRLRFGSGFLGFLWLLLSSVLISVAGVDLLMANPNSQAASVVIAFGTFAIFSVLIGLYLLGTWKLNFTECTAGGIRTRRVFWIRQCSWSQVSDISVERGALSRNAAARGKGKIRVVKVRRNNGPGFLLVAPIDGAFRPIPTLTRPFSRFSHSGAP